MEDNYIIRMAGRRDAADLARLLTALGHPIESESILNRWEEWTGRDHRALIAVRTDGESVGMISVHQMMVLHRAYYTGRITALMVDDRFRHQGIGRALMAAAESVLAEWGCQWLEVTSNMRFSAAHSFYKQLGYSQTSVRFRKSLTQPGGDTINGGK